MLHCYTDAILAVTKEMMMVTDKILACLSGCPTPIPIIQISATVLSTNSIPAQQCNAPLFVFSIAWPSLHTNTILVQMQHNFQPRDVFCSRVWKARWWWLRKPNTMQQLSFGWKIKLKIVAKNALSKKGVAQLAIAKSRLLAAGNWLAGEWIERCPMPKCQNANSKQFDKKAELYCIRKSFLWREPFDI